MNSNDKYKNLYQDDYDELLIKMSTATYLDDLGESIERKRKELMRLPEYSIPKDSLIKFKADLAATQKKQQQHSFFQSLYNLPHKVAIFICIIFMGLTMCVTTVDAFRIQLINFIIHTTEEYTNITLDDYIAFNAPKLPANWDGHFYPHYIPEGFEITKASLQDNTGEIIYNNESNSMILYTMHTNTQDLFLDTEDTTATDIMINDYHAKLYTKDNLHTIVFNNNKFVFILSGDISLNELVTIAENIKNT